VSSTLWNFIKRALAMCGRCRMIGRWRKCARCRAAYYCGAACQRADWPRHRDGCRPPGLGVPDLAAVPHSHAAKSTAAECA
jgi:hypothetical protein